VRPEGRGEQDSREVAGNPAEMDNWDLKVRLDLREMLAHLDSVYLAEPVILARLVCLAWMAKKDLRVFADSLAIPASRADLDGRGNKETKVFPGWSERLEYQERMESLVCLACRGKKVVRALPVDQDSQDLKALKVPWAYPDKRV